MRYSTVADYHASRKLNNLIQKICTSLELNYETYYKAVIYTPSSISTGFWTEHFDVKRSDLESIKYVPGADNIQEEFEKDWDGNRRRLSCIDRRKHILTSHVDIDANAWIHR